MDKEKILELTTSIQHGLFATVESPKQAIDYAYELIETLPKKERSTAYIALHVVLNSIAAEVNRLIV